MVCGVDLWHGETPEVQHLDAKDAAAAVAIGVTILRLAIVNASKEEMRGRKVMRGRGLNHGKQGVGGVGENGGWEKGECRGDPRTSH
jgi:hypothetical protein